MGAFDTLGIAGSSMGMHQTWLDTLANNIANSNTITSTDESAFQAQMVIAAPRSDGGVEVAGIAVSDPEGILQHAPDHPLADEAGYVRGPAMDMSSQMRQMIMAQRGFQAAVQVTKYAQDTYASALEIGR